VMRQSGGCGDLLLLAGGRSTRFGPGDKALARLGTRPLSRHSPDRCAPVTTRTVLNCRSEQRARLTAAFADHPNPVAVAVDSEPDAGPLAGMAAGFRAAESEYALVLACDMPFVSPALVAGLFDRAAGGQGAVPVADGRRQPTCAVYHVESALTACEDLLAQDDPRPTALTSALSLRVLDERTARSLGGPAAFRNVNTQAALHRAERRHRTRAD
jgi:molybdopterin-guanine dinucleotide biosynthesis protein A